MAGLPRASEADHPLRLAVRWHGIPKGITVLAPPATFPGTVDVFWLGIDGQLWHAYRVGGGSWSVPALTGVRRVGSMPS
jgi:hypothetical protein